MAAPCSEACKAGHEDCARSFREPPSNAMLGYTMLFQLPAPSLASLAPDNLQAVGHQALLAVFLVVQQQPNSQATASVLQ